jgi:exodeoxyribonuclease VIII
MAIDGIRGGISNADYHADKERISCSGIKKIVGQSPMHFKLRESAETDAMKLGTATHTFILEGEDVFNKQFAVAPKCDRRTTDGKRTWYEFLEENANKIPVTENDFNAINNMANAVAAHPEASSLFSRGVAEQSILWTDPDTGIPCKCRPDWLRDNNIIVDLKTTQNATLYPAKASIRKYGYDVQDAFYLRGAAAAGRPCTIFVFVFVETVHPYGVGVYYLDRATRRIANLKIDEGLMTYKQCRNSGIWPGPNGDQIIPVSLVGEVEVDDTDLIVP